MLVESLAATTATALIVAAPAIATTTAAIAINQMHQRRALRTTREESTAWTEPDSTDPDSTVGLTERGAWV